MGPDCRSCARERTCSTNSFHLGLDLDSSSFRPNWASSSAAAAAGMSGVQSATTAALQPRAQAPRSAAAPGGQGAAQQAQWTQRGARRLAAPRDREGLAQP